MQQGECSAPNYALLYDRVQIRHGRPQRYGSQVEKVDGVWKPLHLEDPEHLDALRARMQLPPISEYLEQICKTYDLPGRGWFTAR